MTEMNKINAEALENVAGGKYENRTVHNDAVNYANIPYFALVIKKHSVWFIFCSLLCAKLRHSSSVPLTKGLIILTDVFLIT